MDWLEIGKIVASAIGGGAVGSLVTQWSGWGIEKRKQRLQRRRELITGWRLELLPLIASSHDTPEIWIGPRQTKVLSSPFYASLRPHLSEAAVKEIEDPQVRLVLRRPGAPPSGDHWSYQFPLKIFVDEIARIERYWNLV